MIPALLLIDRDAALRQALAEQLRQHEGFTVEPAADAAEALALVGGQRFDLVLLDARIAELLLSALRQAGMPVLVLAETDAEAAASLDAGAGDVAVKPLRLTVLVARIKALLRRAEQAADIAWAIGPFMFRPSAKLLVHRTARKRIRLTEKEVAILRYLYRAGDAATGREALLGEVWGYNSAVTTHTLETHVYRLRQKIEADPANAVLLVTEPGGYRLVP